VDYGGLLLDFPGKATEIPFLQYNIHREITLQGKSEFLQIGCKGVEFFSVDNLWKKGRALLEEGLTIMGLLVPSSAIEQLLQFTHLLLEWNRRFNLTGYNQEEEVISYLLLDALSALPSIEGTQLADIGTGAGIPGIPLKIVAPPLHLLLVEAHKKKCLFLQEVVGKLSLPGVTIVNERAEKVGHEPRFREQFSTVVAKALAPLAVSLELTTPLLQEEGRAIYYKGKQYQKEIQEAQSALKKLSCTVEEVRSILLPFTDRTTHLVLVRKHRKIPPTFPRRAGLPQKKPL